MATSTLLCALAFLLIAGSCWAERMRGVGAASCTYTLKIQTSCLPGSGTINHVFIKVTDKSGNSVQSSLANEGGFKECAQYEFTMGGNCLADVCKVEFYTFGSDDWTVNAVDVEKIGGSVAVKKHFNFDDKTIFPSQWEGIDMCVQLSRGKETHPCLEVSVN